jgi:hypothetical protein
MVWSAPFELSVRLVVRVLFTFPLLSRNSTVTGICAPSVLAPAK